MPATAAKAKPKPKVVRARRIISVDAIDENGRQRGLLERAKIYGQKRRPKKPLTDLFTKLAEKSTVDISQVRWGGDGISSSRCVPGLFQSGAPIMNGNPSVGPQSV